MTTQGAFVYDESFSAAADLNTKQFYGVKVTAMDTINIVAAATDRGLGVLQNKPKTGEAATVRILGISKVVSDGSGTAIAVGDIVGFNSSGKAVKKTTADYAGCGVALDASSADGVVIRVLLLPYLTLRTAGG